MTDASIQGNCPACAIAAGSSPTPIVSETPAFVAFLDPDPVRRGHLRVIPRAHHASFNDLPVALARQMLTFAEYLADAQRRVFQVDRVGFLFAAKPAGHAAVQLVPLLSAGDVIARRSGLGSRPQLDHTASLVDLDLARTARLLRRRLLAAERMGAIP